ncbi:hypothetical protein ACFLXZ_02230, partial [Chloroflexota bacterium]
NDITVRELMEKIELVASCELTSIFEEKQNQPIKLEIVTKDGESYILGLDYPLGSPENPMSDSDLYHKFRDLASSVLSKGKLEELFDSIMNLEKVRNIREMVSLLY